jgi:hypothetical protein
MTLPYTPATVTDEARAFFDAYEALPEEERVHSLRELSAQLNVPMSVAFRWVHVYRPQSVRAGGDWPYDGATPVPPSLSDSAERALAARDEEAETEVAGIALSEVEQAATRTDATMDALLAGGSASRIQLTGGVARADSKALYLADRDQYVVFLDPRKPPIVVERDTHEAMLMAYSDWDGYPVKVSDICEQTGLTPAEFTKYRAVFGWNRSTPPVSAAQLAHMSDDEVITQLADMREESSRMKWAEVQRRDEARDAGHWRNLRAAVLDHFRETLDRVAAVPFRTPELTVDAASTESHTLLIPLNDWQVGSFAHQSELRLGRQFDREVFERMIDDYVVQLSGYVDRTDVVWGRPVITLLGDLIHGLVGETIHGTKLGRHMREFDWEQAEVCLDALYRVCDAVVALFGEFKLISLPGNHEGYVAQIMAEALKQRYRNYDCEFVIPRCRTHQCMIGSSYFTFDHGASPDSNTKGGKIPRSGPARDNAIRTLVMARPDLMTQAKAERGGVYFVMGDQHHTIDESPAGVELIKLPALPSGDRYADENLWHSRPAQAVLLVAPKGLAHMERFYFDNERVFPEGAYTEG